MKNYKHIIWDWNGTLLDDVRLCVESMNLLLEKYNLDKITIEKYKDLFDFPVKDYYLKIGFDFNHLSFHIVGREYIDIYEKKVFECNLQVNSNQLLSFFSSKGLEQTILSAREQIPLEYEVKHYQIDKYITRIIGLNDYYANGKTENGIRFMNDNNLNPQEVIFIGDTTHDFEVAREMGVDCILIANGHNSLERLLSTGTIVLNNLDGLLKLGFF